MTRKETAKQVVMSAGGIVKTADLLNAGLNKADIIKLNHEGYIERIRHGYYQLSEHPVNSEELLLKILIPEGIICMESALYYYGYSDFTPRVWTIAVPRTISRAKLKITGLNIKAYYLSSGFYKLGQTTSLFNGVRLPVYDKERTICDCFKYQARLDQEMFSKAIHAYVADPYKDLVNLSYYAKQLGVIRKLNDLMEVMLNE